jgi:hypothetical protein
MSGEFSPQPSGEENKKGQRVKRLILPSGRTIEVVYYEYSVSLVEEQQPEKQQPADLCICPECDRGLVYPVQWEESSATHWEVLLRCPNCEWSEVGSFDQATVDRFDENLDLDTEMLIRDLKRLTKANMTEEVEAFTKALDEDLITADDFMRSPNLGIDDLETWSFKKISIE